MSRKLLVVALTVTATVTSVGVLTAPDHAAFAPPIERVAITAADAPVAPPAIEVLQAWDAARAAAWARGDPSLLRRLYTPASGAGHHDRTMLRTWRDRGLVVRGLETQLLSVRELSLSRTTWTLLVTDRLAGGVAVGRGVARPLPQDEPTTRIVRLRLVDGRWRVAAVRTMPV
jgi:hypothetical protein